jgi:tRNA threonylcarbamoyl adenosine modification protein YeaZ
VNRILAIECSTPQASVAVVSPDGVVFEREAVSDRRHNALIFDPLRQALDVLGKSPPDEIVIGIGPGSYSGTRVAIAAGQGVAMARGCAIVGLTSLLGLQPRSGQAVGDARRRSAWIADLAAPVPEPRLVAMEALADEAARSITVVGPMGGLTFPPGTEVHEAAPSAGRLGQAWLTLADSARESLRKQALQPIYLRPPHVTAAKPGHPLLRRAGPEAQ